MLLLAVVEPHTHPVSWVQYVLVGVQIIVATVSVWISKRYYDGLASRGEKQLETHKADVRLKHQQDNERLGNKVRTVCESLQAAAMDGTRADSKTTAAKRVEIAHERLDNSDKELRELDEAFRGFNDEMALKSHIGTLLSAISQYKSASGSADPHVERVRVCSTIETEVKALAKTWKQSADARLEKLKPGEE